MNDRDAQDQKLQELLDDMLDLLADGITEAFDPDADLDRWLAEMWHMHSAILAPEPEASGPLTPAERELLDRLGFAD